ncbi:MAG: hypothetical protein JXR73_22320 [Candidatus Omnitrophica bacterium]|nr:hypothetical protein [Candidatus Omnitrophota bacterium]
MSKRFLLAICWIAALACYSHSDSEVISIHPDNFLMLGQEKEIFFPQAVNADFLLSPDLSIDQINQTLANWSSAGINTLRLRLDSLHAPDDPLDLYLEKNGRFKESILTTMDRLLEAAEQHKLHVILVLFDVQRLGEHWDSSPYNKTQGGPVESMADWFIDPSMLSKAIERTRQIIERYKNQNILAWEIARGANVWEQNKRPNYALMDGVNFWVVRLGNLIRKEDDQRHLTALSFLPNTLPEMLLGLPQIQLHFIQVEAGNARLAAQSIPPYLHSIRSLYKKPIFIVETTWKGDEENRALFMHSTFWGSLAYGSSTFLTPLRRGNAFQISSSDLAMLHTWNFFQPEFNWAGIPRPISSPAQLNPPDSYTLVESIFGYDRFFWIDRNQPAQSKAIVSLQTVEGYYSIQWFDPQTGIKSPLNSFRLLRNTLTLQTPEFERGVFGVLRLLKRKPSQTMQPES